MQRLYLGNKDVSTLLKLDGNFVYVPFEENYGPFLDGIQKRFDFGNLESYPGSGNELYDLATEGTASMITGARSEYSTDLGGSYVFGETTRIFQPTGSLSGTGSYSMVFVFTKADDSTVETIVDSNTDVGRFPKVISYDNGDFLVRFTDGVEFDNRFDVGFDTGSMLNEWHQLNIVRDEDGGVSASLDNNPLVSTGRVDTGSADFYIFSNGNAAQSQWSGSMAQMLFYTSSLTNENISQIYNNWSIKQ